MFTKEFEEKFWKSTPYEIVKREGVVFGVKIKKDTLRMAVGHKDKTKTGFVQVINGQAVAFFKNNEILLIEDIDSTDEVSDLNN